MGIQTALVVDDSRSARYILQRLLEQRHIHVDVVDSAQQALSYLREYRPDVVFMDDVMPGMDGHQAVEQLASDPRTQAIPIIMYTAHDYTPPAADPRQGVIGVLSKPFTAEDVNALLGKLEASGYARTPQRPPTVVQLRRVPEPKADPAPVSSIPVSSASVPVAAAEAPRANAHDLAALRAEWFGALKDEVRLAVEQWFGESLEERIGEQIDAQHAIWRNRLNELRKDQTRFQDDLLEQRIPRLLDLLENRFEQRVELLRKNMGEQIDNGGLGPLQRIQIAGIVRSEAAQVLQRPARQAARQAAAELMRNDVKALNLRVERLRQRLNVALSLGGAALLACVSLAYLAGALR